MSDADLVDEFERHVVTVFTLVCVRCVRGWESTEPAERCDRCGGPAQLRGRYMVVDVRPGGVS